MKKLLLVAVLGGIAFWGAAPAQAAMITGGLSIVSKAGAPGTNGMLPVDASGAQTSLDLATGLDFTTTGVVTPGVTGIFDVVSTSGDFNVLWDQSGSLRDFSFVGTGSATYPYVPITGFEIISAQGFYFDLLTIAVQTQTANLLTLTGTGLFHLSGYEDTPGTFYFSANQDGNTLSFSASEAVPEPGSMLLLGTGLFGLAGAVRRRIKK